MEIEYYICKSILDFLFVIICITGFEETKGIVSVTYATCGVFGFISLMCDIGLLLEILEYIR